MVQVLIVNESRIARRAIEDQITQQPGVEVVGSVFSVDKALERIARGAPEVILVEPALHGALLGALSRERRSEGPATVVWLVGNEADAATPTVRNAVRNGAEFFARPDLAGLAKSLGELMGVAPARAAIHRTPTTRQSLPPQPMRELVAIVASTGGPTALAAVLGGLGSSFDTPIAIVQHMPTDFLPTLAANLSRQTGRSVTIAADGEALRPGATVLAPGDTHLRIEREPGGLLRCVLRDGPKENGCKPAGDVLLRTASVACGRRLVGVCLTGMGTDGAAGMELARKSGAFTIAQDEPTSVVWGMPGATVARGGATEILPITSIAPKIVALTQRGTDVERTRAVG